MSKSITIVCLSSAEVRPEEGAPPEVCELVLTPPKARADRRLRRAGRGEGFSGPGNVTFDSPSAVDPWHRMPAHRMVAASWGRYNFVLPYGHLISVTDVATTAAPVEPPAVAPVVAVDDPHVVGPQAGVAGEHADQPLDRRREPTQPLVVAGCWGRYGNRWRTWRWANRSPRVSLVNLSSAWTTARVFSSASVIRGAIPTVGRLGSSGSAFSRSSVRTYSAVARVSKISFHESLPLFVWVATLIGHSPPPAPAR
jgi:hypothetical protein